MAKSIGFGIKAMLGVTGVLFCLVAGSAMATTVTSTSVSLPNGSTTVNINDTTQSVDGGGSNIITGTIGLQTNIGALSTYCVDLFDYINTGSNSYTFSQNQLVAGSTFRNGTATGTFTQSQVNELTALLINGSAQTNNVVNTAAMQIAIWAIEYDTPSNGTFNITNSDSFYFSHTSDTNSTAALTQAQTYLNDVTTGAWATDSNHYLEYLTASGTQNLIYLATGAVGGQAPEPSTIAVFGMGLIGLWAARRRKLI